MLRFFMIRNYPTDVITIFNELAEDYDNWFKSHPAAFQSELEALRKIMPKNGIGLEIGVGSGRFAEKLGIRYGVEPAANLRALAEKHGIQAVEGMAESLPFPENHFDYAALITALCFVKDPLQSLREAKRVIKSGGKIILGIIDRKSPLGKNYEKKKSRNSYYRFARFFSTEETLDLLKNLGFKKIQTYQTLSCPLEEMKVTEEAKKGYGKGGFVAIGGIKIE